MVWSRYKYWDGLEWFIFGLLFFVVVAVTVIIIEFATSEVLTERAIVLERFHEGQKTSVGMAFTSNGSAAPVVTSSGPQYFLLLEFTDGRRALVGTDRYSLVETDQNAEYYFRCRYGGLSKSIKRCTR